TRQPEVIGAQEIDVGRPPERQEDERDADFEKHKAGAGGQLFFQLRGRQVIDSTNVHENHSPVFRPGICSMRYTGLLTANCREIYTKRLQACLSSEQPDPEQWSTE